jgi:hypothetical protein
LELERQRLSAEEENARQKERSRQIEREKNMITRELSQKENENEYLVCFANFLKVEVKSVLRIGSAHNNVRTLQCKHCPNFECFEFF